jgi:hypothetical protein
LPIIWHYKEPGHIQICWAITSGSQYLGYKTPTVAIEPSVEHVAEVVHLMGGRIGTHMSLQVPPWDSMVRPWGQSFYGCYMESHGGTKHVGPEAAAMLKDHAETNFDMYYFGLR